jgi:hypothetical protein
LFNAEYGDFIDRNFDSAVDLVRGSTALLRLVWLGGFRRMHALIASVLQDWRLIRLLHFKRCTRG